MLRRKLYPEAEPGPAERVGRARVTRGVDQIGLPCMSADWARLAIADSEVGELLMM